MGRIIIADDDELLGEIVSGILLSAGHGVGWLSNGRDALEAMRFRPPDLAILDWDMPGISGLSVLREMRNSPDLSMVPVIMLTAISGEGDQTIAFFDGADDYLTKPFDANELIDRAEWLMANNVKRASSFIGWA